MEITGFLFGLRKRKKEKKVLHAFCMNWVLCFLFADIFIFLLNWRKLHLLNFVYEIFMRHCPGSFQVTCVFSGDCWCMGV